MFVQQINTAASHAAAVVFSELLMPEDYKKRLYISVWNSYPCSPYNSRAPFGPMQLEFLGCMSFGIHHVMSENKVRVGVRACAPALGCWSLSCAVHVFDNGSCWYR